MINTISYGSDLKVLKPFIQNNYILQSFCAQYNNLHSIDLFFYLYPNKKHDYEIDLNIIDQKQNVFLNKKIQLVNLYKTGYFTIGTDLYLTKNKIYYLYLNSFGGDVYNKVSFVTGYRKKMQQLFINGNQSFGQLCFNLNFEV